VDIVEEELPHGHLHTHELAILVVELRVDDVGLEQFGHRSRFVSHRHADGFLRHLGQELAAEAHIFYGFLNERVPTEVFLVIRGLLVDEDLGFQVA